MNSPPLQQKTGLTRTLCQPDWCGPTEGAAALYHRQLFLLFFECQYVTACTYGSYAIRPGAGTLHSPHHTCGSSVWTREDDQGGSS